METQISPLHSRRAHPAAARAARSELTFARIFDESNGHHPVSEQTNMRGSMKRSIALSSVLLAFGFSAALVGAATEDYIINKFDQASEASPWGRWWGDATQLYEFDPAKDADGNPSSGSLKATIGFDRAAYGGENQFALYRIFPVLDATKYTNLVFDLYWDPSSPKRPSGDHGYLDYGFRTPTWGQIWLGGQAIPANAGWIHVTVPISPTLPNITTAEGVVLKMWAGDTPGLTGTAVFWLDNVKLIAITNNVQIPPPTLSISDPTPGLNLIASLPPGPNAENQRQNIRTVQTYFSWIDSFDEVEFSIDIAKYPSPAHNRFQTHLFLCPKNALPYGPGDSAPDYNATNAIFLQIANNADGSAYARFMYKTNQPFSVSMLFNSNPANGPVGTLAIIGTSSPLGTWKVKFMYDTVAGSLVTLTTPSGSETNFTMPPDAVELFADHGNGNPLYAWVGTQPNTTANIGQAAVIKRVQVKRDIVLIDDNFANGLDSSVWQVAAAHAPGVIAVPADAEYWISWAVPDAGFRLESTATLTSPSWAAVTVPAVQILDRKQVLLRTANLPSADTGFFRMYKPPPPPGP
jgi:hypothetical protein